MKLSTFHIQEETKILTEGIRFTTKEINKVKKNSRNVMVGFEFEFVPLITNVNSVRDGNDPRDVNDIVPQTREEWTLDDIYESPEYDEARNEAENEAIDEQLAEDKKGFKSQTEETMDDDYGEDMEAIHLLVTMNNHAGFDQHPFTMLMLSLAILPTLHPKVTTFIKQEGSPKLEERDVTSYFSAIKHLVEVQKLIKEYNMDVILNQFTDNREDYAQTHAQYYKDNEQAFIAFLNTTKMDDIIEFVNDIAEAWIPESEDIINKAKEALEKFQWQQFTFDFNTQNENLTNAWGIIENLTDNSDMFSLEDMATSSKNLVIMLDLLFTNSQAPYDTMEVYIDKLWGEGEENGEEARQRQEYYDHGFNFEFYDERSVIRTIQDNRPIVVLDSNGDPYVAPDDWTGGSVSSRQGVSPQAMKQFMIDHGHMWKLSMSDFEDEVDPEGHGMVEFKSKPKPIKDALILMEHMFAMINDIGDTSNGRAGLHTNISLRNERFTKANFNAGKLIALLDIQSLHEFFPVRGDVSDMTAVWNVKTIWDAADPSLKPDTIIDDFEDLIQHNEKYQTINLAHMEISDVKTRRVEFRAIGGKDYSHRQKIIEFHVYKLAYVLGLAFDDEFMEKEYRQNVLKFLNQKTKLLYKRYNIRTFEELRQLRKKNPSIDTEDKFGEAFFMRTLKGQKS